MVGEDDRDLGGPRQGDELAAAEAFVADLERMAEGDAVAAGREQRQEGAKILALELLGRA